MKVLFSIGHPAHVHLFKNAMRILEEKGNTSLVVSREKEMATQLLDAHGIQHKVISRKRKGFAGLMCEMITRTTTMYRIAKRNEVDILVGGPGDIFVAITGRLLGKRSIVFDDTEHSFWEHMVIDRAASVICTPACFKTDLGKKQIRYNGYHALAHLHPDHFKPDPSVLGGLDLHADEKFVILRFIAWDAAHDTGQHGFDMRSKCELIAELQKYARVLISSESPLPEEFEPYRITLPAHKFHHLLYYASLCVTEGSTTATEAAVLGTPAVYVSTLWPKLGCMRELADRYGLLFNLSAANEALIKASSLIQTAGLKQEWQAKREKMLNEKIDVTDLLIKLICTQRFQNTPDVCI